MWALQIKFNHITLLINVTEFFSHYILSVEERSERENKKKKEEAERKKRIEEEEEKMRQEQLKKTTVSVGAQSESEIPTERDEVAERRRYKAARTQAEFEVLWKEYQEPFRKRASVMVNNRTMPQNIHGLFLAQADPYSLMTLVTQVSVDRLVENFYAEVRTIYLKGKLTNKSLWDVIYFGELSRTKLLKYTKLSNQEFKIALEVLKGERKL